MPENARGQRESIMDTRLYLADTDALEDGELFRALCARMPAYRREKIDALRTEQGKRLSLGAGALLRHALRNAGVPPEAEIAFGEWGKPFLPGYPEVYFSLSHSGSTAACIIAPYPVGCDAEGVRPELSRAWKQLSERERQLLESTPEGERPELFCRIWVLKESLLKAVGTGLTGGLESFSVLPGAGAPEYLPGEFPPGCRFREWPLAGDVRLACCGETGDADFSVTPETVILSEIV